MRILVKFFIVMSNRISFWQYCDTHWNLCTTNRNDRPCEFKKNPLIAGPNTMCTRQHVGV